VARCTIVCTAWITSCNSALSAVAFADQAVVIVVAASSKVADGPTSRLAI